MDTVDVERLREACERYGVARLEVFGSVSRGEATSDSDIDLLYELKPGTIATWDFLGLEDELSQILGRPVDLVDRSSVNKYLREQVLHDARPFYTA
ncbi:nucleotidyltransferase family protein [Nocardioides sp.]|uniref:nucleotidyltransferase family protein n=1 Tax=Nocardioides sp. TaxID=35761 RepID=UPI00262FEE23|nr:nucleotidyltransferase family protein [Nocardioides sp.]